MSDWLWEYSDVIRIALALASAWCVMDVAGRFLWESDDERRSDDE